MRIEDLRVFLHVARHRSLHRAASVLGVTQSALSKTLARLESGAGGALFERSPRGVVLTSMGQDVIEHARTVITAMDDLYARLDQQRAARAGRVRLAVLPHLVPTLVSPLLAHFLARRPAASFSVHTMLSPQLLGALQGGEVDVACAAMPQDEVPGLAFLPLGPLRVRVVVSAAHPRLERLGDLASLAAERWLMPAQSIYLRQHLEARFAQAGLPAPRVAVESTLSQTAFTELLRHSDLAGVLPERTLGKPEGQGIVGLDGVDTAWEHELALFWRADSGHSPLAREFCDALVAWSHDADL
ncbi:LysR family transcriptional regulator [Verticiella sediminum]|uniref:LysR family transcriptional regulator n=1 Tax=Verticiella sediminum TaxID=1247510 RepID=A0A556A6J3_9BURK|nr:LysR family transcriptional regulator [Verticiella sediminum]TSH88515.1 LysR family transcriptional regulator [Verticiella sediminum]